MPPPKSNSSDGVTETVARATTPPIAFAVSARPIILFIGLAVLAALLLAPLWYAGQVLLLAFGGIIIAVFLSGVSTWVSRVGRMGYGWSLAIVIGAILALCCFACWLLFSRISGQIDQLGQQLPEAFQRLTNRLDQYRWGQFLTERVRHASNQLAAEGTLSRAASLLSGLGTVGIEILLVILVGVYGAVSPDVYLNGMVKLFPKPRRPRMRQALQTASYTLWWWIICRLISMTWVGVATAIGVWLLGIPLALTLGLIAGLFKFVPYIGPWIAAVPALLLAFVRGPSSVVYVGILYFAIEMIDDQIILPLLQWRNMWLPPALAIFAQVLMGALWGMVGILVAMPLCAVVMVLVQVLYVQDTLGDEQVEVLGQSPG